MKKYLAGFLTMVAFTALTGCGGGDSSNTSTHLQDNKKTRHL